MKFIIGFAVVFLVFLLPAGSYLYLHYGLEYRKTALAELNEFDAISLDDTSLSSGLVNYVSLLHNYDLNPTLSDTNLLLDQFENNPTFQTLSCTTDSLELASDTRINRRTVSAQAMQKVFDDDYSFALVDTAGSLRRRYMDDKESIQMLVKHISILLPQESRYKKVLLKPKDADVSSQ